jgi:hypothetical protein
VIDDGRLLTLLAVAGLAGVVAVRPRGGRGSREIEDEVPLSSSRFPPPPRMALFIRRHLARSGFSQVPGCFSVPVDLVDWKFRRFVHSAPTSIRVCVSSHAEILKSGEVFSDEFLEATRHGGAFFSLDDNAIFVSYRGRRSSWLFQELDHELTHFGQHLLSFRKGFGPFSEAWSEAEKRKSRQTPEEFEANEAREGNEGDGISRWDRASYESPVEFWAVVNEKANSRLSRKDLMEAARKTPMTGKPKKRMLGQLYRSFVEGGSEG